MSTTIDFANLQQAGVYLVGATELDTLDGVAHADGLRVSRINLDGCTGKDDLLQRIAAALRFPDGFGANWDALADSLGDLGWLPQAGGHAWLLDHADALRDASEADFDTLCDILDGACGQWRDRGTPCFAFLALPDDAFAESATPRSHDD